MAVFNKVYRGAVRQESVHCRVTITDHLIKHYGFKPYYLPGSKLDEDRDKYTCVLRVGVQTYLFYSEELKHFTLAYKHEKPKGLPGGGIEEYTRIVFPRTVYDTATADIIVSAFGCNHFVWA